MGHLMAQSSDRRVPPRERPLIDNIIQKILSHVTLRVIVSLPLAEYIILYIIVHGLCAVP